MSVINVPPTKTKQLELKRSLAMASEGYTLLEQKREILVMELMQLMNRVKSVQKEVDACRSKAHKAFRQALALNGVHTMESLAAGVEYSHKLQMDIRISAGMHIPTFRLQPEKVSMQNGFVGSSAAVDDTKVYFLEYLQALTKQAELESAVWLLARELKKTQRHVNALEHIFIPNYRDTLHYIGQALESKELESFFTMKTVKKNMETES